MFHKIKQEKMKCTSLMIELEVKEYLYLVDAIYKDKGGIPGQRAPLKTKTAKTIRARMVDDIIRGVTLPPLVIGVLVSKEVYMDQFSKVSTRDDFLEFLRNVSEEDLSIIDGMQRTTAIHEAIEREDASQISAVRVEFWVAEETNSLIYRMLVLNTGQVPWDVARQLEAIYRPLLKKIESQVGDKINFLSKDVGRRSNLTSHEYETEDIVELLLIFSSRKRELNLKDQIAQDFVRLDMVESSSHSDFLDLFIKAVILLSELNASITRFNATEKQKETLKRYASGRALFNGAPPKAGFISALAIHLFGKPGYEPQWDLVEERLAKTEIGVRKFIATLDANPSMESMEEILKFEVLEERVSLGKRSASQVGRYEREFFENAFMVFFKDINEMDDLTPCWVV
jgi:hypothetical protein